MKTALTLASLALSATAFANPVDAAHCEAFINHLEVSSAGASYAGTRSFKFGVKVLNERLGGGVSHVEAYVKNADYPYAWHVEQVAPDYFIVSTTVGSYFPEVWASGQFEILVMSKDRIFYRVKPATGKYFITDEAAYRNVQNQGNVYYDPYFKAWANTQNGAFGGYYNPGNCF